MAEGRTPLRELASLFLRLGATAFGGPAAHIALMQHEVVQRRGWLDEQRFLDLLGATNLIPGPNSTELAIHIGYERGGFRGLLVAGAAFILPAMLLTGACGWLYVTYGALPQAGWVLYGVKPVILGVIAQALRALGPQAVKDAHLGVVAALAGAALLLGASELAVLFGAGAAVLALRSTARPGRAAAGAWLSLGVPAVSSTAVTLPGLFGVFAKIGSVLFGSGYVLIAFLRADLVQRLGWLTEAQLLDAVAVGQITPGPVFTTATFVGYVLAGPRGAAVATLGIFLPAFVFVAATAPFLPRLRASKSLSAVLDGVNAASFAVLLIVTTELARTALVDLPTAALSIASAVVLIRYRLNSAWLVAGGALFGLVLRGSG